MKIYDHGKQDPTLEFDNNYALPREKIVLK